MLDRADSDRARSYHYFSSLCDRDVFDLRYYYRGKGADGSFGSHFGCNISCLGDSFRGRIVYAVAACSHCSLGVLALETSKHRFGNSPAILFGSIEIDGRHADNRGISYNGVWGIHSPGRGQGNSGGPITHVSHQQELIVKAVSDLLFHRS